MDSDDAGASQARAARRTPRASPEPHRRREREIGDERQSRRNLVELDDRPRRRAPSPCYLSTPTSRTPAPFLNWARDAGHPRAASRSPATTACSTGPPATARPRPRACSGMPEAVGELLGPIAINDVDLIIVPGGRRRRDRHAHGLGPRLLRQDPRLDGEMSPGVRRDLRRRTRRRGAARACTTSPSTARSPRPGSSSSLSVPPDAPIHREPDMPTYSYRAPSAAPPSTSSRPSPTTRSPSARTAAAGSARCSAPSA